MLKIRVMVSVLSIWKYLMFISLIWLLGGFLMYKDTFQMTMVMPIHLILTLIFQFSAVYVLLEKNLWSSMIREGDSYNFTDDYNQLLDNFGLTISELFNRPNLKHMTLGQRIVGTMRIVKISIFLFIVDMFGSVIFIILGLI